MSRHFARFGRPASVAISAWIVAYDIADDARRRAVAKLLADHGVRMQQSLFLCRLTRAQFLLLRRGVRAVIDRSSDCVHWVPLCATCLDRGVWIGSPCPEPDQGFDIV